MIVWSQVEHLYELFLIDLEKVSGPSFVEKIYKADAEAKSKKIIELLEQKKEPFHQEAAKSFLRIEEYRGLYRHVIVHGFHHFQDGTPLVQYVTSQYKKKDMVMLPPVETLLEVATLINRWVNHINEERQFYYRRTNALNACTTVSRISSTEIYYPCTASAACFDDKHSFTATYPGLKNKN